MRVRKKQNKFVFLGSCCGEKNVVLRLKKVKAKLPKYFYL